MKRLARPLGLALVVPFIALWQAPATWLDAALRETSHGTLGLGDPKGGLWQGGGTLQALLPQGELVTLAPLRWTLRLTSLAGLRLTVVSSRDGALLLDASAQAGGLLLHGAHLELPAALLGSASPTLREADLGGRITFTASDLGRQDGRFSGRAELRWQEASSSLAGQQPLGDYRIRFDAAGAALAAHIDSPGQPALALAGTGQWQPGQAPQFNISATPAAARRPALEPLLRMIGRETRPGVYQLQWDGKLGAAPGKAS